MSKLIPHILFACFLVLPTTAQAASPFILTSAQEENKLGEEVYRDMLTKEKVCQDKEVVAFVENVAKRITAVAPDKGFKYEIAVLESNQVNAFCLPGGKMAVFTGILPYCANEAGLATVLGHEVAHATLRHGGQRMSQSTLASMAAGTLQQFLNARGASATTTALTMTAFDASTKLGILLPYSRSHETEADLEGLTYLAKAGYDPAAAPAFWKRFGTQKSGMPAFLSTHPSNEDREKKLARTVPLVQAHYDSSPRFGMGAPVPGKYAQLPAGTAAATEGGAVLSLASIAEDEVRLALQEALSVGFRRAIAGLKKPDGYFKDAAVKIIVPDQLKEIEKAARTLGRGRDVDAFVETMNRAAEKAVPQTTDILAKAIAGMTIADGKAIVRGKDDEATQYFRKAADANFVEAVLPIVVEATEATGATKSYKTLLKRSGFVGKAIVGDFDLDRYVARKTVDGLYLKMADVERTIRANPAGEAKAIIRKVFGATK